LLLFIGHVSQAPRGYIMLFLSAQLFRLRPPHGLSLVAELFRLRPLHGLSLVAELFRLRPLHGLSLVVELFQLDRHVDYLWPRDYLKLKPLMVGIAEEPPRHLVLTCHLYEMQ
jgi:hypothetical protein